MAITESLPVGNEAAVATAGKTPTVDATSFAASFAAAGKASGGAVGGKSGGVDAPVKGQQDLATWVQGQGSEVQNGFDDGAGPGAQAGVLPGAAAGSGLAVSSLIGKQEIVETAAATAGAAGSEDLQDAGVGAGMQEAVWLQGGTGVAGSTPAPVVSASDKSLRVGQGSLTSLGTDGASGKSSPAAGAGLVAVVQDVAVGASAEDLTLVAGAPTGVGNVGAAASAGASQAGVSEGSVAGGAVAAGATADVLRFEEKGSSPQSATGSASVGAKLTQAEIGRIAGQQSGTRTGVGNDGLASVGVVGPGSQVAATAGQKTVGAGSTARKEKSGEAGDATAAAPVQASVLEGAGQGTQGVGNAWAAVGPAPVVAPGAVISVPVVASSGAVDSGVQIAGVQGTGTQGTGTQGTGGLSGNGLAEGLSTPASSAGRVAGRLGAETAASALTGTGRGVRTAGSGSGTGAAGSKRNVRGAGTAETITSVETAAAGAAALNGGDGSVALPVTVGTAAAAPFVIASGAEETGLSGIGGVGVVGQPGSKAPAAVAGTGAGRDKDSKAAEAGRRSESTAGTGHVAHAGAGEAVAGVNGTAIASGVQGATAEKSTAQQGKTQDAAQAVSGAASLNGAAVSTAHTGAAVGWNGVVTAPAAPVHTGVSVAASGTLTSVSTSTSISAGGDGGSGIGGGLGSGAGLSSGLVESGQGHTTLQATPTVLEVGVPGGTHGWLKIRAELGEGGAVQASVSSATQAGQETLRKELPAMSAYLQSEHVPVSLQMAHGVAAAAVSGSGGSEGLAAGLGSGSGSGGQAGAHAEQSRNDGLVGASSGGVDAGDAGSGRQQGADGDLGAAVTVSGGVDGVSAAVATAAAEWASPLGYGGSSSGSGGNWVNVIA